MAEYGRVGSAADYAKQIKDRQEELEARRGGSVFPKGELDVPRDEPTAEPQYKVVRVGDEYGNLNVDSIRAGIQITYDPRSPEPFSYSIEFPEDEQLKQFFLDAELTTTLNGYYHGRCTRAYTADQAKTMAQREVDQITVRFKKYIDGKNAAKTYTYTSKG